MMRRRYAAARCGYSRGCRACCRHLRQPTSGELWFFCPTIPWSAALHPAARPPGCSNQAATPLADADSQPQPGARGYGKRLLHQVGDRRLLAAVQAVSSDLPCRRLAALLQGGLVGYPGLQQLSAIEALARGKPPSGLSKIELNATLALLYGHSITSQAQMPRRQSENALQPKNLRTKQDGGVSSASGEPDFPGSRSKRVTESAGMTALTRLRT